MSEQPSDAYELLSAPMPKEAIQRTKSQETKKGYDTTGIGYQFVVNRFNEALGPENWAFSWLIQREAEGEFASGRPRWEICVRISIKISVNGNWLEPRSCVGGHVSTTYDDALKGAITNGFKKAAAFWGVAREAYEGTIDPDSVSQEEGAISPVAQETIDEAVSPPPTTQEPPTDRPLCPECGQPAIIKGKEEWGGGWVCWKKEGGCGAKFDSDPSAKFRTDLPLGETEEYTSLEPTEEPQTDYQIAMDALSGALSMDDITMVFNDHYPALPKGAKGKFKMAFDKKKVALEKGGDDVPL